MGDRDREPPLERALAVRDQRRAQAAAEAAAEAARGEVMAAEAAALEAARQNLDALRLGLATLQQRVEGAARSFDAARARVESLEEHERHLELERARLAALTVKEAEARQGQERVESKRESERLRLAAEEQAAREAERRAIDEIDRRLAERARAQSAPARVAVPAPVRPPKPRFDVRASVILESGESVALCPLVDLSLTGALFSTLGAVIEGLELGSRHAVTIVADDDAKLQIEVVGRVVRCVDDTYALDWSDLAETQAGLAHFLDTLSTPRPASEAERRRAEIAEIDARLEGLEASPEAAPQTSRRAKARLVVSASLLIEHGGRLEELVLLNVSRTGGLVASGGAAIAKLRVGALALLSIARSDDPTVVVDLLARIVRQEGHTTAVDWSEDQAAEYDVARFLDQLVRDREEP